MWLLRASITLFGLNGIVRRGSRRLISLIRADLEALIDRKSFYRLVDLGVHHEGWFGVWSGGAFFGIIPSGELE